MSMVGSFRYPFVKNLNQFPIEMRLSVQVQAIDGGAGDGGATAVQDAIRLPTAVGAETGCRTDGMYTLPFKRSKTDNAVDKAGPRIHRPISCFLLIFYEPSPLYRTGAIKSKLSHLSHFA